MVATNQRKQEVFWKRLLVMVLAVCLTFTMMPTMWAQQAWADTYVGDQGGKNTLTMSVVNGETSPKISTTDNNTSGTGFVNVISNPLISPDDNGDISFGIKMSAGWNNFDEEKFNTNNKPEIKIYAADDDNSDPVAGIRDAVKSSDFKDGILTIYIDSPEILEAEKEYKIVFGSKVQGNNSSKTLGVPVTFYFTMDSSSGGGTSQTVITKSAIQGVASSYPYTGKAIQPVPTVKLSGKLLEKDTDYTVEYEGEALNVGDEAQVTITGKGAYSGQVTLAYNVVQAEIKNKNIALPEGDNTETNSNPVGQKGYDGTALGQGASATAAEKAITSMKSDADPAGSKFAPLMLKSTKQTKKSEKVTWKKVSGAKKYILYGNKCGKKNKMKKIKTTTKNSFNVKKIAGKKLKKKTYYKYIVVALDANNNVVSTSKVIHVATKGSKKKANHKSVKVTKPKKARATVKEGKTTKIKAKAVKVKKTKVKKHRALCYESSNTSIATVTKKGVIKGKKKGICKVYVYAQNGVSKTIKVTVK